MEIYINVGNFIEMRENLGLLQQKIDAIAKYYNKDSFDASNAYMTGKKNVDMIVRVSDSLGGLNYASRDYYESDEWNQTVHTIAYDAWLNTLPAQELPYSEKEPHYYIYLLKDDLSFALMTMCGDVGGDYITLMDYSDISDVNVYTADYLLNSVLSGFDMDKFYQIPVKDSENATINDVFDFLKKEK